MSDSSVKGQSTCPVCNGTWDWNHECVAHGSVVSDAIRYGVLPEQILSASGGAKYDTDKPRMDLLDSYAIEQLAKVLTFGAKKYAAHNWRKGISKSRLIAAALRHIFAYLGGTDTDEETGLSHIAHAMCCCMFLLGLEHRVDLDDRYDARKED